MARGRNSNPVVRILVLGDHGVGKNCLESRFTTGHWPPSYDASLTLCSRRFYTFQHGPEHKVATASAASLATENTINSSSTTSSSSPSSSWLSTALPSSSSSSKDQNVATTPETPLSPTSPMSPLSTKLSHTSTPASSISEGSGSRDNHVTSCTPQPCAKCLARAQTHLIEIINYPSLHHAHTRQHVLHKGEFDAVLLVYDVGNRASFEHIKRLHAEITLATAHHRRRKAPPSTARAKSSSNTGLVRPGIQKRGSLFSLFAAAPPNGKKGVGVSEGGEGMGTTVVAVVGNKSDLDEDPTPRRWREHERVGLDKEVDDIDYALALFGHPLFRDVQGHLSASSTPIDARPTGPALVHASRSSDTLDKFLLVGRTAKAAQAVANTEVSGSTTSSGSQTAVHGGRQVSNVDGEGLALELSTQVPFFETSARTGENVEELFEAIARAALKEMGRSRATTDELMKGCLHRNNSLENCMGREHSLVGDVAPKLSLPVFGPTPVADIDQDQNDKCGQQLAIKAYNDDQAVTVLEQAVASHPAPGERQQVRRQDSMLEKMRMFMRKQPPVAQSQAA